MLLAPLLISAGAFNTYAVCTFFDGNPYQPATKLQPLAFFFLASKLLPPFLSGFLVFVVAYLIRRDLKLSSSQPLPKLILAYSHLVFWTCVGLILIYETLIPEHSPIWKKGEQLLYVLNYVDIPKKWRNTGGNGFPLRSFFIGATLGRLWLEFKTRSRPP